MGASVTYESLISWHRQVVLGNPETQLIRTVDGVRISQQSQDKEGKTAPRVHDENLEQICPLVVKCVNAFVQEKQRFFESIPSKWDSSIKSLEELRTTYLSLWGATEETHVFLKAIKTFAQICKAYVSNPSHPLRRVRLIFDDSLSSQCNKMVSALKDMKQALYEQAKSVLEGRLIEELSRSAGLFTGTTMINNRQHLIYMQLTQCRAPCFRITVFKPKSIESVIILVNYQKPCSKWRIYYQAPLQEQEMTAQSQEKTYLKAAETLAKIVSYYIFGSQIKRSKSLAVIPQVKSSSRMPKIAARAHKRSQIPLHSTDQRKQGSRRQTIAVVVPPINPKKRESHRRTTSIVVPPDFKPSPTRQKLPRSQSCAMKPYYSTARQTPTPLKKEPSPVSSGDSIPDGFQGSLGLFQIRRDVNPSDFFSHTITRNLFRFQVTTSSITGKDLSEEITFQPSGKEGANQIFLSPVPGFVFRTKYLSGPFSPYTKYLMQRHYAALGLRSSA